MSALDEVVNFASGYLFVFNRMENVKKKGLFFHKWTKSNTATPNKDSLNPKSFTLIN